MRLRGEYTSNDDGGISCTRKQDARTAVGAIRAPPLAIPDSDHVGDSTGRTVGRYAGLRVSQDDRRRSGGGEGSARFGGQAEDQVTCGHGPDAADALAGP